MQVPVPALGLGYSRSFLRGVVSAMRALEEMGWLPEFVTRKVWRCAKWATSQGVARPYAGLEELRSFARACDGRAQWTVYGMAVLSFTCLLRVGEAAPIRRGGSRGRGLGFHTVKCDTHIIRRKLGSYGRARLRWLDREGSTSAVPLAHLCPQGSAYLQMVMATALSGCESAHTRWHAWRRGGSAALRWLGLPVRWLAWWGRWMSELVAAHCDAPNDFIVADVELPWPSARGDVEFEWRVVSLKDMFPGELLALCVRGKDVGPEEDLMGWRDAEGNGVPDAAVDGTTGGSKEMASLPGRVAMREVERVPTEAGTRGSRMSLWPSRLCRGDRDPSVLANAGREKTSSTSMLSPPPPSAGTSSIRRL